MKDFIKRVRYKWQLKSMQQRVNRADPLKLIIGAGNTSQDGWIATDKDFLDVTDAMSWEVLLQDKKAVNVLAEHVIEHLTLAEVKNALTNIFLYLSNNGCLRIAVPDGFNTDVDYINYVKPNGWGAGSEDHKILWNVNSLTEILERTGYYVVPRQYFTENGKFVCEPIESLNGEISRKDIDNRTSNDCWGGHATKNSMVYTSLIVDAYKRA